MCSELSGSKDDVKAVSPGGFQRFPSRCVAGHDEKAPRQGRRRGAYDGDGILSGLDTIQNSCRAARTQVSSAVTTRSCKIWSRHRDAWRDAQKWT
ncbi:hypothetical protein E4U42_003854 [Claviceps africana]|uniref:Uncharacterized protein n=1 Tax=Claviceps africana TaxID=83212 RepID=A0A8K0J769_9HYPO|nr:hypothetical protein E4U42_003854 [Claviceps africana]